MTKLMSAVIVEPDDDLPVADLHPGAPEVRGPADDADQAADEVLGERVDHRAERRPDHHRDREVDDVAAQEEVLEALDHARSLTGRPDAAAAAGAGSDRGSGPRPGGGARQDRAGRAGPRVPSRPCPTRTWPPRSRPTRAGTTRSSWPRASPRRASATCGPSPPPRSRAPSPASACSTWAPSTASGPSRPSGAGAASVHALDLADGEDADWPPNTAAENLAASNAQGLEWGSGFALAHRALGSAVQRVEGNVYDLTPDWLGGPVDTIVCSTVLQHLRDPIRALENIRDTLVPGGELLLLDTYSVAMTRLHPRRPIADFRPAMPGSKFTWWVPNLAALRGWATTAGFLGPGEELARHKPMRGAGAGDHLVSLRFRAP
jgi:SAM-dependent methyltransferase